MLTPSNYYYRNHEKSHAKLDLTRPYAWSSSTVTGILDNKVYLGHTVGLRTTTISYKNKTTVHRPESECAVVENTHPALIKKEQWDIVQEVRTHKKRTPKHMDEPNLFSGLAYCADCKRSMVLHRASSMKKSDYNFKCYTYGKRGRSECTPHHIREEELYAVVLDDLRRVTHFARQKERQFAEYINRKNTAQLRQEINTLQKELGAMRRRRNELTALFKRLYEDNVLGRVTNEQFRLLSADYNAEQRELDEAIPQKEERQEKLKASAANVEAFIEKAKRYRTIDELTPQIVRLFISRIEVGERAVKHSRHSAQKIRIVYRDIGEWDHDESAAETNRQQPQLTADAAHPVEKHGVNGHLRQKGKIAELALGYGGSVGALKAMGALEMGLSEDELQPLVTAWRNSNQNIVKFWWDIDRAAMSAVKQHLDSDVCGIEFAYRSGMLFITLPSGRRLSYVKPKLGTNQFGGECITYEGIGGTKKWERLETYGPKLVENIVQATSRDILCYAMQTLSHCFITMHIHDELVIEAAPEADLNAVCEQMGRTPPWAAGLKLRADGYETMFYKKD